MLNPWLFLRGYVAGGGPAYNNIGELTSDPVVVAHLRKVVVQLHGQQQAGAPTWIMY